ncbi:ankyrin repeat domain-containing protein [Simkania sp.]|uniref:ankyrin repeat domain-containing protein n=1 Tax=Simkania sp. TaxID=34094 RepID=UPI003B521206
MKLFKNGLLILISLLLPGAYLTADELPFRSVDSTTSASIENLNDELIEAIMDGDAKAVNALIAAGADVNAYIDPDANYLADYKYQTVLKLAAKLGHADIVKALINAGANVESGD